MRNTLRARVSVVWQQVRTDINRQWSVWGGANLSRLLGPTVDSPLTLKATQLTAGAGFGWRF